MAKPPPYPPKSSGRTMAGPSKKKLKHPSFAGSDTEPYNVRPQKPKAKPKAKPKGPQSEGARPMFHHMQKMPKQTGPKKTSKMRKY